MDGSLTPRDYEIRIGSLLHEEWSSWFDGFEMSSEGEVTVLRGTVIDQSALHGLLAGIRDLGVPLIEVRRIVQAAEDNTGQVRIQPKEEQ